MLWTSSPVVEERQWEEVELVVVVMFHDGEQHAAAYYHR
jgi:hypothetical protein